MPDWWLCKECGCQGIAPPLEICPHCHAPRPTETVALPEVRDEPTSTLPAKEREVPDAKGK